MAAYHVANLSPSDELKILKEKFWSDIHSNVLAIYIALTKGQRPPFKQFIKPSLGHRLMVFITSHGAKVANHFVNDQVKYYHLFQWFFEVGDKEICRSIENAKIFNSKTISFFNTNNRLSPSDLECMTVFLTCSSHKEWEMLNLWECYIQDQSVHILHRGLTSCDVTITSLPLSSNGLTKSSSSAINDITISCRVKELNIRGNDTVGKMKDYTLLYPIPPLC